MLETKTTTMQATVTAINDGENPSLSLSRLLTRRDGGQKNMSIILPICDSALLMRAKHELKQGDTVEVVLETRWAEKGIPKTLLGFIKISLPHEKELTAVR